MLLGFLKAHSGGVNPLKMECWSEDSPAVAPPFDPFINATTESYSPDHHPPAKKKSRPNTNTTTQSSAAKSSVRQDAERERERNILLGFHSPAALQGMIALQEWNQKYNDVLKQGPEMFSQPVFRLATLSPLAGLWRMFELR
jgi:hypothetical protein